MTQIEHKTWRDFAHTASVVLASALARGERARPSPLRQPAPAYIITLLAAASEPTNALPRDRVLAQGGRMSLAIEERPGELWCTLQAQGFATIRTCAGRDARLLGLTGRIDYRFRFDRHGRATCVLDDRGDVREDLRQVRIIFDDPCPQET